MCSAESVDHFRTMDSAQKQLSLQSPCKVLYSSELGIEKATVKLDLLSVDSFPTLQNDNPRVDGVYMCFTKATSSEKLLKMRGRKVD